MNFLRCLIGESLSFSLGKGMLSRNIYIPCRSLSIDMIPPWMRAHLFGSSSQKLEDQDLATAYSLPEMQGGSLDSYFQILGEKQSGTYAGLLKNLTTSLPDVPSHWVLQPGWTCYRSGLAPQEVPFPDEAALVFDVEVCMSEGYAPTLATAVSTEAWYCWVSPSLYENIKSCQRNATVDDMIPLGNTGTKQRVVVGHFVSYDSARVKESYDLNSSGLRYFDTMAAHACVSGITNLQRFYLNNAPQKPPWSKLASAYSLGSVYHLYCGRFLDKGLRNVFVDGSLEDVREHFQELTTYCALDVKATHAVFCQLFPLFMERYPHPVTLAAMLEMSTMYIPVSSLWPQLLQNVKSDASDIDREVGLLLKQLADESCGLLHGDQYRYDPWLWDQNWSLKTPAKKSTGASMNLDDVSSNLSEYPEWYRRLVPRIGSSASNHQSLSLTLGMNITPKLMRLCWGPYPLHYMRGHGWGMLVPVSQSKAEPMASCDSESAPISNICLLTESARKVKDQSTLFDDLYGLQEDVQNSNSSIKDFKEFQDLATDVPFQNGLIFRKLPHSLGIGKNVGNPLSRDVLMNPALHSMDGRAEHVLDLLRRKLFWNKNSEKLHALPVTWSDKENQRGALIPSSTPCGDFTRQPNEDIVSTLIVEDDKIVGKNLCDAFDAPPCWTFLSAQMGDVEMWMASLLSDGLNEQYGSTSLGRMFLDGSLYCSVAEVMEVTESQAKWLTFAVLYGAQRGFTACLLRRIDTSLTKWRAHGRSDRLLEYLLGKLNQPKACWEGGVLSDLWTKLDTISQRIEVSSPILNSRLSRVLESDTKRFRPLVRSWLVQSSAVDFLHLLLTCFRELMPSAHLSLISAPKMKVIYLVPSHKKYEAVRAFHVAHLYARAFCASQVNFSDMPSAHAFLPTVTLSCSLKAPENENIRLTFFDTFEHPESKGL